MDQDATWYGGKPRPGRLCVTWGRSTAPQFSVHVCYGQMAGWMKTPLGTKVHLGSDHIVLDGVTALREKGTAAPPLFGPSIAATVAHLSYF